MGVVLHQPGISGSWQGQNFISASQVTPNLPSGTLSSSAQIASDISGAFASPFTAAGISGSFNAASSSFSTRVTTNETNITSITSSLDANRVVFTTTGGQLATDAGMTYDSTSDRLTVQALDVVHLTSSFITASTIQTSGSNIFGDDTTDTQTLIGTTKMTGSAQITGSLDVSGSITTFDINMSTWTLGADGGSNYYYFTGPGDLGGTEQNPDIHLTRGQKYRFYNPMNAHPFQIQDLGGSAFSTGVTNNGVQLGFLSFDVPMDGPTHLKYQCTAHAAMIGNIYIADARVASGSFSGSFQGDGSALTNLPASSPFPFTGDAQITGSLTISGSLEAFTNVSTNVQIGNNAGAAFTTAANSVIIGQGAGDQITTGTSNTIIGSEAGGTVGTGILDNVFIGYAAGKENTSDSIRNVFIGYQAGYKQSGGYENVAIGYRSMANFSTTGDHDYNSALGAYTLYSINTGQYNVAIGRNAGYAINDGDNNILIGRNAGSGITYGGSNIIIGSGSLGALALEQQLRIGNGNSLVTISGSLETGDLIFASTASAAYFVGDGSNLTNLPASSPFPFTGDAQITGSLTISGSFIPLGKATDDTNVIIGKSAATSITSTSGNNVVIGNEAGGSGGTFNNADGNVCIGYQAGNGVDGGDNNVCIGYQAGYLLDGETETIAIGYQTLRNVGNSYSVGIGSTAGRFQLNGPNTLLGGFAGMGVSGNSQARYNTILGYKSGYVLEEGYYNIIVGGQDVGLSVKDGYHNVLIGGEDTGYNLTDGTGNIILGSQAGKSIVTGNYNIIIGHSASLSSDVSNQLFIGSGSVATISASLTTGDILLQGDVSSSATSTASFGTYLGDGSNLTGIVASTATTASYVETSEYTTRWNVTNNGSSAYRFAGNGVGASDDNPTLYLTRGEKYLFNADVSGHPFEFRVSNGGSAYSDGVTNNAAETGDIIFEVQMDAPTSLVYQCTNHAAMVGNIYIVEQTFPFTGSAAISGSLPIVGPITQTSGSVLFSMEGDNTNTDQFKIVNRQGNTFMRFNSYTEQFSIGNSATVQSSFSTVVGNGAQSNDAIQTIIGYNSDGDSGADRSVAIGMGTAKGQGAIAIGVGAQATAHSIVLGRNVADSGTPINSVVFATSTDRNSDGQALYSTSNAFEWYNENLTVPNLRFLVGPNSSSYWSASGNFGFGTKTPDAPLTVEGSGSTLFNVIGSEGTLFAVDDDLDGVIFTANDRTGLPVLQAEADGEVYLGKTPQSLYTTAVVSATSASSTASLVALSTSSYDSAYFDFTCISASNSTVGSIMSTWNGETITFNEHTTSSIGTTYRTAGLDLQVIISASQAQLVAITDSTSPNTWKIKTTVRSI